MSSKHSSVSSVLSAVEDSSPKKTSTSIKGCLRANWLTIATVIGVCAGLALGFGLQARDQAWSEREAMYIGYIGELFLNMLKCIIIPLIIPSLIVAVGSLDAAMAGKIGLRAVVYYLSTTIIAVILGIILVMTIKPGDRTDTDYYGDAPEASSNVTTADTLMDLLRNAFPPNIIQATMQSYRTVIVYPERNETLE